MQLSKREINIMLTLIDTAAPVTTASLAEQFNRSVRSIKYDLDNLRTWLKMKELTIRTRRNKGIWIEWSESTKLAIKNELLHVERNDLYPDQTNRIYRLILWLSLADTPLTSNEMAEALKVSRNTIIADLDKMDFLLLKYAVTLDRKNHYGFKLVGDEANVRHLMEAVIQKSLTDYDVYYLMQIVVNQEDSNPTNTYGMPPKMAAVFNETLQAIAKLMDKEMLDKFNYSELLAIILRVCIATIRLKNNRTINSYRILSQQTMHEIKAELPFLLMKKVFYHYQFPFLEDEYIYIFSDVLTSKKDENIAELTTALIDEVSEKEQLPFNKDKQLFNNLFAHLSLRLHKKHVFVNEYNPFVDDIKSKYAKLFRHIKVVSERQIDDATIFVNDSFISYIALHFLVAYEKIKPRNDTVTVVYICSTGLGVTNLIQQKVMEEVPNIELISFASVLKAQKVIRDTQPDLVISIFPLDKIESTFVKVHPLPTPRDIENIKLKVTEILSGRLNQKKPPKLVVRKQIANKNGVEDISRDLLLAAFIVQNELKNYFTARIQVGYEESFLLHVMMMVHRIQFESQYENAGFEEVAILMKHKTDVMKIEQIMAANKLVINRAEIIALLQYVTLKEEINDNSQRSTDGN